MLNWNKRVCWARWATLLALILVVCVSPSLAHGYLLRSIPEDRSALERAPTRLQYWFSEDLEADFSSLVLRDSRGAVVAEGGVDPQNSALLTLRLPASSLPDGAYVVELSPAFSSDGHVSLSTTVFFVGEAVGNIASQAASTLPQPLEILWKMLLLSGTHLLFGTGMLYVFVLRPAWGSARYAAGDLPLRVMQRLNALIWIGLALAISGNLLALVQQSTVFFNTGLAEVISGNLWQVVRIGSRFGDVWTIRMIFLVMMLVLHTASLLYRERYPETVAPFWSAGTWCMALVLGAGAIVSHAAGSLVMPWLALTMHWLHTLASAFWVGGLAALALVLPVALQPLAPDSRQPILLAALRRYSALVIGALAVVITSGLYNSSNWFFAPQDVISTYGGVLGLKVLMVMLLVAVGGMHHLALRPTLARRLKVSEWPLVRQAGQFHSTLNGETLIAVFVLVAAATLSSTPIPQPTFLDRTLPPQTQTVEAGDYLVTATIAPGGTGVNTFDVSVTDALSGVPQDDLSIRMQLSAPDRDVRGSLHVVESLEEGLYATSLGDIDLAGRWWSSLDIRTRAGLPTQAAFEWQISAEANVIRTLPPSVWTLLLAFAVTGAVGLVLLPSARALVLRMNLSPQSLLTAGAGIGISVLLMAVSVVVVEQQRVAQLVAQTPLPTIINPTLPTQASVRQGQTLYNDHCIIWQSVTDFRGFINQVDRLRDEEIYQAVQRGWRSMPPCNGSLDAAQTWDIVNFVRVLHYQFQLTL